MYLRVLQTAGPYLPHGQAAFRITGFGHPALSVFYRVRVVFYFYRIVYSRYCRRKRMKKLYALRGAVQCENTEADIRARISFMYEELLSANGLEEKDIVSVVFSVTPDLDAANPCSSLRNGGHAPELALFSCAEPAAKGAMERIIRVIIHCYLEEGSEPRHVYRNGAEALRPDRAAIR
jgi:chorismate mutase